jgi:hypothetical protein
LVYLGLGQGGGCGALEIHRVHQVLDVVNMNGREGGRQQYVTDFVRRAEIRAGFRDNAGRTVGSMAAAAVEWLLKTFHKKDADPAGGNPAAELLDIKEFAGGVPITLAVNLLEAIGYIV